MAKASGMTRTTRSSSPKGFTRGSGQSETSFSQITGLRYPNDKKAIISTLSIVNGMADNVKLHTGYTVREVKQVLKKQLKKL